MNGCVLAKESVSERQSSSRDEFPKQRSPACTFDGCFDLSVPGLHPSTLSDHCNDRRLTEGQLLRSASVKRKPCGSPTKNGSANLTPLRLCRYLTDNDAGLVTSYIVQRNM